MKKRLFSSKEIFKDACIGAAFGLGIGLIFLIVTEGFFVSLKTCLVYLFFGGLLGFILTTSIEFTNNLIMVIFPRWKGSWLFQFALSFAVGFGIFYIFLSVFKPFKLAGEPLLASSFAVGVFTALVGLFFAYSWEVKTRLGLEEENKKLAIPEERNRIARQLHGSIAQSLYGLNSHLNTLVYLHEHRPAEVQEVIRQLQNKVEEIHKELKLMINELKPAVFIGTDVQKPVESVPQKTEGRGDNR